MQRLEQAKGSTTSDRYAEFRQRYRNEPALFVEECFDWRKTDKPAPYQLDILTGLVEHQRASGRGPHGLGKSALASWAVLWFATTRDGDTDWKVPTTASAWRQLTKFLWPEIHKWARRLRWEVIGRQPFHPTYELQSLSLKLTTGEAFAVVSDEPELIEGAHASSLLYIFDEAKAIPAGTWDAAEGAFSNAGEDMAEALALAISTPGEPSGRFYQIQSRQAGFEDWWTRYVTLAEAIAARRISREWADQRKKQWGEKSAVYQNRVEGNFAESGEDSVIPLFWVEKANERWAACEGKGEGEITYGVDPARYGEDKTAIARMVGRVLEELIYHEKQSTMQTAGWIAAHVDQVIRTAVDVIGIGAGVVDRLRELGHTVIAVNVGESTTLTDESGEVTFVNLRSALWWCLRDALDPDSDNPLALPPDDILTGDLTTPTYMYMSKGQIKVESKDDIRKRIGRSTDAADAVALALYAAIRRIGTPAILSRTGKQ